MVQHQPFMGSGSHDLNPCQDVIQVVERLDLRVQRSREVSASRARHQFQSPLIYFLGIQRDMGGDYDDCRRRMTTHGVQPEIPFAAADYDPNVATAQLVPPDCLDNNVLQLLGRQRDIERDCLRPAIEAFEMLIQAEDAAVVAPDTFKHPVSVEIAAIEDRDLRLGLGNELPVDID